MFPLPLFHFFAILKKSAFFRVYIHFKYSLKYHTTLDNDVSIIEFYLNIKATLFLLF